MREITSKENKNILVGLMQHIDDVCSSNNIKYSLSGGSLLGAIRHQGFIPWDDDADIMLTRGNYEKLKKCLIKEHNPKYVLLTEEDAGYYYQFMKLCDSRTVLKTLSPIDENIPYMGVFIDIFPIDRLPSDSNTLYEHYAQVQKLQRNTVFSVPGLYYQSPKLWKKFLKIFIYGVSALLIKHAHTTKEWKSITKRELTKYNNSDGKMGGVLLSEYGKKEIIPYRTFEEYKKISFGSYSFEIISDFNVYLESLYGDYMTLPPLDKRKPKHAYIEYWKD